jgi:hypothetical protein
VAPCFRHDLPDTVSRAGGLEDVVGTLGDVDYDAEGAGADDGHGGGAPPAELVLLPPVAGDRVQMHAAVEGGQNTEEDTRDTTNPQASVNGGAVVASTGDHLAQGCVPFSRVVSGGRPGDTIAAHWAAAAAAVFPYRGLQGMSPAERDLAVGLRLGGIAAKLIVDGAAAEDFTRWIHTLDAHLPGEWGQINHSRYFVEKYGDCLLRAVHEFQLAHLQCDVRALKIPSDYVRCIDGFTPHIGESLLIHVILSLGPPEPFPLKWVVLDLTPQSLQAAPEVRREVGRVTPNAVLGFHTASKTVDKLHTTENRCGLGIASRALRYAGNCGDGAVEGPYGLGVGEVSAIRSGLPSGKGWGSLDGGHAVDKAGSFADTREKRPDGFVNQFHRTLRGIRAMFGFGAGRTVARSTAQRFGMSWRAPLAPHSDATRMVFL